MTNFKGTKGKWHWHYNKYDECYQVNAEKIVAMTFYVSDEDKSNALLISKAPEMLEMLENCFDMFDKLRPATEEEIREMKNNIKQLIKEATEL